MYRYIYIYVQGRAHLRASFLDFLGFLLDYFAVKEGKKTWPLNVLCPRAYVFIYFCFGKFTG